jgi:hypothetical protein
MQKYIRAAGIVSDETKPRSAFHIFNMPVAILFPLRPLQSARSPTRPDPSECLAIAIAHFFAFLSVIRFVDTPSL